MFNQEKAIKILKDRDLAYLLSIPNLTISRQHFTNLLTKIKLFELSRSIPGCIVEGSVFRGNGLGAFLHLSSAYDPYDFSRRIVGFDSFEEMKSFHESDRAYKLNDFSDIDISLTQDLLGLHVENTAVPKMPESASPRVELVRGDAVKPFLLMWKLILS